MAARKSKPFTEQFDTIVAFLGIEVLALMCFGLGGFTGVRIFQVLGAFVSLGTIPFIRLNYSKKDIAANLKWLLPLALFMLLLGVSSFFIRYYRAANYATLDTIVYSALETIGLAGFFLLGVGLRSIPGIRKDFILYGLLGSLALYCLIVGLYSIVRYGPFYASLYHGMSYYYKGVLYPVYTEGKALIGFGFMETSLRYAGVPAMMLATSAVGLLGLCPKKEPRHFAIRAVFAGIGLLYSIIIPYWFGLAIVGGVYAFTLVYWLLHKFVAVDEAKTAMIRKVFKIIYFVLIGVVIVGLFVLLTENRLHLVQKVLGRIPGFLQPIFNGVWDCLYNGDADIGKINLLSLLFGYSPTMSFNVHMTNVFQMNILWQNGLIAFLLLLFLTFFYIKNSRDYLSSAKGDLPHRMTVVALILGIYGYFTFFADEQPLVHAATFMPFTQSQFMMVLMFLAGYSFVPSKAKEDVVHE